MMYRDVVDLISYKEKRDVDGYVKKTAVKSRVFADVSSVGRTEFYHSYQAGIELSCVIKIRACDFNGQKNLEFLGKTYEIIRAYLKNGEFFELSCKECQPNG